MEKQIVHLSDEHHQPIRLWADRGAWWWNFADLPENDWENPNSGPYATRTAAVADAEDFCNSRSTP